MGGDAGSFIQKVFHAPSDDFSLLKQGQLAGGDEQQNQIVGGWNHKPATTEKKRKIRENEWIEWHNLIIIVDFFAFEFDIWRNAKLSKI